MIMIRLYDHDFTENAVQDWDIQISYIYKLGEYIALKGQACSW